jgi:ubiquinone/menaquinone biosynthesis C-methylase UbiE
MDIFSGYSRDGSRLSYVADVYGQRPNRLKLTAKILAEINLQPGCELLEVGCGEGKTSAFLAEQLDAKVVGVDLEARILTSACQRNGIGWSIINPAFCLSEATFLPFSANKFDCVWCESTLSTIENKTQAIAELRRILKPGGKLIVLDFVLGKPVDRQLQKSISFLPCLGRTKTAEDYFAIFDSFNFEVTGVVDYSDEIKKSGYWLGMMFGSLDEVISRIASGNCCSASQSISEKPSLEYLQLFLKEAALNYSLFVMSLNS